MVSRPAETKKEEEEHVERDAPPSVSAGSVLLLGLPAPGCLQDTKVSTPPSSLQPGALNSPEQIASATNAMSAVAMHDRTALVTLGQNEALNYLVVGAQLLEFSAEPKHDAMMKSHTISGNQLLTTGPSNEQSCEDSCHVRNGISDGGLLHQILDELHVDYVQHVLKHPQKYRLT
ncbi:hypothetical protein NDU88_005052 [Pleurodeles waltl]|uniref:Uncharacterized protein n=1 Tax=Pleurodeles waltl TaxID=8319 RepID=A0AAV7M849_PLEWA|nr:hypothetical protein NDU88_005052 [Pleurodeles waltl]